MGNILKLIGFGLAIVGIGLSLALPWWHSDLMGAGSLDISLHKVELCGGGSCTSPPTGGMFGIVAMMTLAYGALAMILIALGGFIPALGANSTRPMAVIGGIVYLVLVGLTYGTMDLPDELMMGLDLHTTWSFKAGIAGAALAIFSPMLGFLEPKRAPEPYRPPEPRPDRPGRISNVPPIGTPAYPEQRPRSTSRVPVAPIAIDLDGPELPATVTRSDERAPVRSDEPLPMPLAEARPRTSRSGLRFVIATAEIREDALVALAEDGSTRELRWAELGGALARELAAPHDTLLVDLVPGGAPPLRFLATSRLMFSSGGKDGGDPRDAMRRLLAFARAMHPEIELEAATTDFLYKRTSLPSWSVDELERYDARYG